MSLPIASIENYYSDVEKNLLVAVVITRLQKQLTVDTKTQNILNVEKQEVVELVKGAKEMLERTEIAHQHLVEDYTSVEKS